MHVAYKLYKQKISCLLFLQPSSLHASLCISPGFHQWNWDGSHQHLEHHDHESQTSSILQTCCHEDCILRGSFGKIIGHIDDEFAGRFFVLKKHSKRRYPEIWCMTQKWCKSLPKFMYCQALLTTNIARGDQPLKKEPSGGPLNVTTVVTPTNLKWWCRKCGISNLDLRLFDA